MPTELPSRWITLVVLVFVGISIWCVLTLRPQQLKAPEDKAGANVSAKTLRPEQQDGFAQQSTADQFLPDTVLRCRLQSFADVLRRGAGNRQEVLLEFQRLKEIVHRTEPHAAALALVDDLKSGEDHATGLGFVIGAEGVMDETPTFRTALVDLLGQTDPQLSADYSRELLRVTDSSDEYALAMRNVAWADPDGRFSEELRGAFRTMLGRADWAADPTTGFLEAFDLAVVTGEVEETAALIAPAGAMGPERPVERAAFVALDRLMLSQPSTVITWLQTDPHALAQSPFYRASLLSRLDITMPEQEALLASYLQRVDRTAEEKEYFTQIFPNGNSFTGYRLVSDPTATPGSMPLRDSGTLAVLQRWAAQPEFVAQRAELHAIIQRLEAHVHPRNP